MPTVAVIPKTQIYTQANGQVFIMNRRQIFKRTVHRILRDAIFNIQQAHNFSCTTGYTNNSFDIWERLAVGSSRWANLDAFVSWCYRCMDTQHLKPVFSFCSKSHIEFLTKPTKIKFLINKSNRKQKLTYFVLGTIQSKVMHAITFSKCNKVSH